MHVCMLFGSCRTIWLMRHVHNSSVWDFHDVFHVHNIQENISSLTCLLASCFSQTVRNVASAIATVVLCAKYVFSSLSPFSKMILHLRPVHTIYCVLLCCFFILLFPGGPHVAASRRLADINAAAGTPVVRRIDGGGLRARAQDYHSGPWT